jgi:penicillin V acylase-like amidase (Ntn superfamily)
MKCPLPAWLPCALVGTTMMASSTARPCTTFLAEHTGQPVFGKDYDWSQQAGLVVTNPRDLKKAALVLSPTDTPAAWTSKYGSLTFNQYGVEMPNAGINEKGLAVEIMWLDSSRYPAADSRPAINELQWIQRALDLFATVAELAQDAPSLRVARAYANVHYLACDPTGDCAAFEHIDGQLAITRAQDMPAKTLANDTYAASVAYLAGFSDFGGSAPMPTSTSSLDRFVRASMLAKTTAGTSIPDSAFAILDAVGQSSTVWSIVYALSDRVVHFRTRAVPRVKSARLADFSLACGTRKILDIDTDATGDVGTHFQDYTPAVNRELLGQTLAAMSSELPAGVVDLVAAYPDTCQCAASTGTGGAQGSGGMGPGVSSGGAGGASAGTAAVGSDGPSSAGGCSCALATRASRLGAWTILGVPALLVGAKRRRLLSPSARSRSAS